MNNKSILTEYLYVGYKLVINKLVKKKEMN